MDFCEKRLLSLISAQEWHLDRLYGYYTNEFGALFRNYNGRMTDERKKQFKRLLLAFNNDMEKLMAQQIESSITLSNACQDDFIKDYIKDLDLSNDQAEKLFLRNEAAANTFLSRAGKGLKLSERVWSLTKQTEEAMNILLESGVVNGRPAPEMARDLKKYLKYPDKQFRRIRNEEGKLILSKPASEFHPGQGVYRSSYKNALRLSRTEVNIAYRSNDFERRKNLPFVMGQRVSLSASHPAPDICDHLIGTYPKGFKFVGWHPQCLCVNTSILLPKEKFKEYLGGSEIDQRHLIKRIPNKAFKYLNDNADQIKGWKNTPYFILDNFKNTKQGFAPKKSIYN